MRPKCALALDVLKSLPAAAYSLPSLPMVNAILKEANSGIAIKDLVRKHGLILPTYYKWKKRYGGMDVAELTRVRELEAENSKHKRMYSSWGKP